MAANDPIAGVRQTLTVGPYGCLLDFDRLLDIAGDYLRVLRGHCGIRSIQSAKEKIG